MPFLKSPRQFPRCGIPIPTLYTTLSYYIDQAENLKLVRNSRFGVYDVRFQMIITQHAYARAALVGNPSDGYFGKTISFVIRNFRATVRLWESPHLEIVPTHGDLAKFETLESFLRDIRLHGYYGGMRLIKAAVKRFHDFFAAQGVTFHNRNFTVEFQTDIPRLVGLSGSSAIVTAAMRALSQFYGVEVPKAYLPTLILAAEKDELGINAGMQDRVIQVYEGMVYMDFEQSLMESRGYGRYEELRPTPMPPLYLAYDPRRAEVSDVPHRNLRALFDSGEPTVRRVMAEFRQLTDRGKAALLSGDWDELRRVTDENFELRRSIMNIAPENLRMVDVARSTGASAHFAGSGGAIVGLYRDGRHYRQLVDALEGIGCSVLQPLIFES
jgi:glucuronokinase